VINKDDGTGEAQAFAKAAGIPILAAIPANEDIRRKSANYDIVGRPAAPGARYSRSSRPMWPRPRHFGRNRSPGRAPGLFKSEAVGRNVVLEPASHEDMCGSSLVEKATLEIVYDTV